MQILKRTAYIYRPLLRVLSLTSPCPSSIFHISWFIVLSLVSKQDVPFSNVHVKLCLPVTIFITTRNKYYFHSSSKVKRILLLGEEASPSIGNTLWPVSTMFTRPAITPPEVNGFGWNLRHSMAGVPQIALFWARSAQKRERKSERNFFCPVNNARLDRFPVSQISRNLHTRRGSVSRWILSETNF